MKQATKIVIIALALTTPLISLAAERNTDDPMDDVQMVRLPVSKQLELKKTEFLSKLTELQSAFAIETDPEAAMDLQRKISAHKLGYEIGLHQLQLDHALKIADTERAEEIKATIAALESRLPKIASPELNEAGQ